MEHGQLTGPNGMRNICGEYHDFATVGIPQQGADLFGKVGTAVYHGQQNTVDLQFGPQYPPKPKPKERLFCLSDRLMARGSST